MRVAREWWCGSDAWLAPALLPSLGPLSCALHRRNYAAVSTVVNGCGALGGGDVTAAHCGRIQAPGERSRIALVSDARLGQKSDHAAIAERLLSISGEGSTGDRIDRKFLSAWTGRLPTRFLIFTNELPRLADASGALANRFIVLTMQNSFLGNEDPGLTSRLLRELPGILNWAREGYLRLQERGYFVQPQARTRP